tara:strand:+ start:83 stop:478 length:396 start_codon:yes stop_codon:yes gene_type:complete
MIGISPKLPLRVDSVDGFYALTKKITETIQQNLKMLILTTPGERMMNPEFGVGLRNFLFENRGEGTAEGIKNKISTQVQRYIPAIKLTNIIIANAPSSELTVDTDAHNLLVRIEYVIPSLNFFNQELEMQF